MNGYQREPLELRSFNPGIQNMKKPPSSWKY